MILNLGYALLGEELELVERVHVEVIDGVITHIGSGFVTNNRVIDVRKGIAMPSLVNAHIHVLDYAFPEYGIGLNIEDIVREPCGLKHRLIKRITEESVAKSSFALFKKMVRSGVTMALIYLEILDYMDLIRKSTNRVGIKPIIFGRPKRCSEDVSELLKSIDGLGIDSPLRYDPKYLLKLRDAARANGKLLSTHISETKEDKERGDFEIALEYLGPDLLIHGVHLDVKAMQILHDKGCTVVLCPRSNMWFSVGLPPIKAFLENEVNLMLGTDNAGLIEPDIWRELEVAYGLVRLQGGLGVKAKELLKAATINPLRMLMAKRIKGLDNIIAEGNRANFIVLNSDELMVSSSMDVYASIVKRGSSDKVLYVINDGKLQVSYSP